MIGLVMIALAVLVDSPAAGGATSPSTVSAALARTPKPGARIDVVGYVANVYACPPCPAGADCKPCREPFVLLADQQEHARAILDLRCDVGRAVARGQRVRVAGYVASSESMRSPPSTELALDAPRAVILGAAGKGARGPLPSGAASVSQTLDRLPKPGSSVRIVGTLAAAYAEPCPKGQPCKPGPGTFFEVQDDDARDGRRLVFRFQPPEGFAQGQRIRISGKVASAPASTQLSLNNVQVEVLDSGK